MRWNFAILSALVALLVTTSVLLVPPTAHGEVFDQPRGPWVDRLVWSDQADAALALDQIKNDRADLYMFPMQGAAMKRNAVESPDVLTESTYWGVNSLLLNPNEQQEGIPWNPFTDRQIREAMQWLVDREYLNREVLDGLAISFAGPFHPKSADHSREIDLFEQLEDQYTADFAKAQNVIEVRMAANNATIGSSGIWEDAEGRVIDLQLIFRIEDERLHIGTYVAEQLRRVGFKVTANPHWYWWGPPAGDPSLGDWHIYTEGWAFFTNVAWDDGQISDFHACVWEAFCARFGPPGTYSPPQDFEQMATALAEGNYTSVAQRQEWVRELASRSFSEANYRIWLHAEAAVFAVGDRVEGFVFDAFEGPWSPFGVRSAKLLPDQPGVDPETGVGGELKILNFIAYNDAWNPWTDPGWRYDAIQRRATGDQAMLRHPHTAAWMDVRVTTTVKTTGPDQEMWVPPDALIWELTRDSEGTVIGDGGRFVHVGLGVTTPSKVTTKLTNPGSWHTGETITMDDVIYSLSAAYRRAFGDVSEHDSRAASAGTKAVLDEILKGVVVNLDTGTIDAYIDFWHADPREIAAKGVMYLWAEEAPVPWEIQEAVLQSVINDDTAIHEQTATLENKIWLDLGRNPASIAAVDTAFATISAENSGTGRIPQGVDPWITQSEATARYAASQTFRDKTGHWYASNGPFVLERVNMDATRSDRYGRPRLETFMTAFRDGYPFSPDQWDFLKKPNVPDAQFGSFPSTITGGTTVTFSFSTTLQGERVDPQAARWFVRHVGSGHIPLQGVATRTGVGEYDVQVLSTMTAGLESGAAELVVIIQGVSGSRVEAFRFTVQSQRDAVGMFVDRLDGQITALAERIDALENGMEQIRRASTVLDGLAMAVVVLTLGAIAATGTIAVALFRRLRG
jgi:peptide/nickel transport system substrate-binding protein